MNDLQKVQLTLRNRWFLNFFSRLDKHWHARSSVGSLRTPSIYRSNCYPLRSFDLEWPRERERTRARAREIQEPALHASQQRLALFYPPRTRHLSFFSSVAHPSSLSLSLVWFFPSLPPHPCSVTLFASHGREGQVETLGITKGPVVPLCISIECGRLSWFLSTWGPEPRPASMANKGSNAWRLEIFPPPSCSFHSQLDPHPFSVSLLLLPSSWCSLRRKEPGARLTALLRFPRAHYRARFMPLCSHLSLPPSSSLHAPEEKRRPSFSSSWKIVDMETFRNSFFSDRRYEK